MKKLAALTGLAPAPATNAKARTQLSVLPDTATLLDQWAANQPIYKRATDVHKSLTGQLGPQLRAAYYRQFAGRGVPTSTLETTVQLPVSRIVDGKHVTETETKPVKIIVKNAYAKTLEDDKTLRQALGDELVDRHFTFATTAKLDFDKVPEAKQEKIARLLARLAKWGGLADAITVKQIVQPVAGFHEARTTLLTAEQNNALDALLPVTAYPQF